MKKFTFLMLFVFTFSMSHAAIIIRDITDFTITEGNSLDFDFNNDGTSEFTFELTGGTVGAMFNSDDVNFVTFGTISTEGWDVIRPLTAGTTIGSSSNFGALGDAYINPFWATSIQMFANGDSYIGTTFKIGTNKYYGWILVNYNNGAVTVKKYAYNNVANQSLSAGQTTGIEEAEVNQTISIYPNPTQDMIHIQNGESIKSISIFTINGQILTIDTTNKTMISLQEFPAGIYFISIEITDGQQYTEKIIKR